MQSSFDLSTLKLSPFTALETSSSRTQCQSCSKSRQWYCPECIQSLTSDTPSVSLPVKLHIVRHAGENCSKSSVLPLRLVLSESQLAFYRFHSSIDQPELPSPAASQSVIVFPSVDAVSVDQIDWSSIQHVIFIDSTWYQANEVNANLPPAIPRVALSPNYHTFYWRPQHKGPHCLATVEAIYLVLRDAFPTHQVDDLLWFYVFTRNLVHAKSGHKTTAKVANKRVHSPSILQ